MKKYDYNLTIIVFTWRLDPAKSSINRIPAILTAMSEYLIVNNSSVIIIEKLFSCGINFHNIYLKFKYIYIYKERERARYYVPLIG